MRAHIKVELELKKTTPSIVNLVQGLIEHACENNVSDIHVDPLREVIRVRFRLDGVLNDVYTLPKRVAGEIVARIKILANLRTDEHQLPQDGRFKVSLEGTHSVDIRTAVTPSYFGESIVLRLLPEKKDAHSLYDLGFSNEDVQKVEQHLKKTYGIILITGPTGSGKTTTLYTLIQRMNVNTSVITIEDPIEYAIDSVRQIQVNSRAGLTFAHGLRSVLRQDPDTIMLGEIRDAETAAIAVNSALTGHLILSTLHTNDASSALPRLLDMKIEPYLIASVMNIIIAQRLVRKICAQCKKERVLELWEKELLTKSIHIHNQGTPSDASYNPSEQLSDTNTVAYGQGCDACFHTGYSGRISIYEVLEMNDELRAALLRKATHQEIKEIAEKSGMKTLYDDGCMKALTHQTTLEEVLRVMHE